MSSGLRAIRAWSDGHPFTQGLPFTRAACTPGYDLGGMCGASAATRVGWRGQVEDVNAIQPPSEAGEWLTEMLAHAKSDKRATTLSEMRGLMSAPSRAW